MVKLANVSFGYSGNAAEGVQGVSLRVRQGECVVLAGASGCGKTTLTRLINGLAPQFYPGKLEGGVQVAGLAVTEEPLYKTAEKVGSVFQNPRSQFFNADTDSEIVFSLENMGLRQRLRQTAEAFGLQPLLGRSIFALSGGEKQKIAFACAYAARPEVFVLDEPSSNLDAAVIEELRRILQLLKQQGKTIVVAEHRLYYLREVADRILYMQSGQVRQQFTRAQFLGLAEEKTAAMGLRTMNLAKARCAFFQPPKAEPSLEIDGVSLYYQKKPVLCGLSLAAAPGEIIGIVGPNGAGKTTFSRALCGLHKPAKGSYRWQETIVGEKQRQKLCYMVMQDVNYQLFAESVEAECRLGLKNTTGEQVDGALKAVNLLAERTRHPASLSGGQKQRVAVAAGMACNKQILVFDEPTSGLDYGNMQLVAGLLQTLAGQGKIIFVVTHDYEFLISACSRILQFGGSALQQDYPLNKEGLLRLQGFFGIQPG
ncbi:MAG: ABC transporter ATP-binding protein [Oscillospiraceae bacterium]